MQWSQIKTLFILSFLILNIYLFFQFYETRQEPEGVIPQTKVESSIEDQLKEDQIKVPNLSENPGPEKESYMTVEQRLFSKEELDQMEKFKNQTYDIIDDKLIISLLGKKKRIPEKASRETIIEHVREVVPFPGEYIFWKWDRNLNIIMLFQRKGDRPIYYNQNGLILLFLNDENEIVYYSQSMLGEEETRQEERTLITPIKAIETLYNSGELFYGDEINNTIEVGFHTRIPSTNGPQVFVPTWKVTVNDQKKYFINAIEGFVFSSNDYEFLEETLTTDLERIRSNLSDENQLKQKVVEQYKERLDIIKQNEGE